DGKVGALIDRYAVPSLKRDDYGGGALKLVDSFAGVIEQNAAPGGELAPQPGTMRGGRGAPALPVSSGRAAPAPPRSSGVGGLGLAILCMGALLVSLMTSGMRRRFPGKMTGALAALLTLAAIRSEEHTSELQSLA